MTITLETTYSPADIEQRIFDAWMKADAFKSLRDDRNNADKYSIVIPPPNVTGSLHMGHALNNTVQDILCRFERMRGKDVLWQVGTDHAGIATQMVVERKLAAEGKPTRQEMGKEKFLEAVWDWKEESGGTIIGQLKRLGASCDWERERFTMDEGLSAAVRKVFVELYNEGLIYKDKRLVNWDPKLLTAISDLEVVQIEKKGSFKWERCSDEEFDAAALEKVLKKDPHGHMYYFDYPIMTLDDNETIVGYIQVATTRPETMLGDTGVAVHPENEKLKHLIGKMVCLPLVNRLIPIVGDEYADPEKGTGAVKITPAHDFNDFEVGKRHKDNKVLNINIMNKYGKIINESDYDFNYYSVISHILGQDVKIPKPFQGLDRYAARLEVIKQIHALGLLAKIEPITHTVPYGDRSNVAIEPFLTDQWYVNAGELAIEALAAVKDGRTNFVPKNWEKTYFEWLENIQPWCISRQLWWGHSIPARYGLRRDDDKTSISQYKLFVAETDDEIKHQVYKYYEGKFDKEHIDFVDEFTFGGNTTDERGTVLIVGKDPDVLDTWFSSALWPFSTLGWPENTEHLQKFYQTDVLVTGFDIIFFWVARMMMMGLHFIKDKDGKGIAPFHTVYIHALVRDAKGQKMSKSKGNVIDPLELIDQYGADALRFTLAAMAAQGRDIKLDVSRVEGYRNFATKLWNATRFAQMNGCAPVAGFNPATVQHPLNQWIVGEVERASIAVTQGITDYKFNEAANALYKFIWNVVCDWHVELVKPILSDEAHAARAETQATLAWVLDHAYALLHPFMPFLTEELWGLTATRAQLLTLSDWPQLANLQNKSVDGEIDWLISIITQIRTLKADLRIEPKLKIDLVLIGARNTTQLRIASHEEALKRIGRINTISYADALPQGAAQFVQGEATIAVPLAGVIDFAAEKIRLSKDIEKLTQDIIRIEGKLNNTDFRARAPAEVIEEQEENLAMNSEKRAKLALALKALG